MKTISYTLTIVAVVLVLILTACNLSGNLQPTPLVFPTPNQTMTALFGGGGSVATATLPAPVVVTNTPQPSQAASATTAVNQPTATPRVIQVTPVKPTNTQPVDTTQRHGTTASAVFLSSAPAMDANWSDWTQKELPAKNVVFGSSADNPIFSFKIGWDAKYLYVAAKVRDSVYVQNATGENLFKGDSLEIMLDTNVSGDYYVQEDNADDFQLGISGGNPTTADKKEAYLWLPADKAGARTDVKIAAKRDESQKITWYEAAIPWTLYKITPANGDHYGFCISFSDNDNSSKNVQQSMVSNCPDRHLTDPTTWGDLELTK